MSPDFQRFIFGVKENEIEAIQPLCYAICFVSSLVVRNSDLTSVAVHTYFEVSCLDGFYEAKETASKLNQHLSKCRKSQKETLDFAVAFSHL